MTCPWKFFTISRLQTFSFSAHSTRVPSSLQLEYVSAVVLPVEWHVKHFDPILRKFLNRVGNTVRKNRSVPRPVPRPVPNWDSQYPSCNRLKTAVKTSPKIVSRLVPRQDLRPVLWPVSGAALKPAPRLSQSQFKYRSQDGLKTSLSDKTNQFKEKNKKGHF